MLVRLVCFYAGCRGRPTPLTLRYKSAVARIVARRHRPLRPPLLSNTLFPMYGRPTSASRKKRFSGRRIDMNVIGDHTSRAERTSRHGRITCAKRKLHFFCRRQPLSRWRDSSPYTGEPCVGKQSCLPCARGGVTKQLCCE